MISPTPQAITETLATLLTPARRRLAAARLQAGLARGLDRVLWACAGAAALEAVGTAAYRVTGLALPGVFHWLAAMVVLTGFAAALLPPLVAARRRPPSFAQTAERLDAVCDEHNRIATAWLLSEQEPDTPFAAAAIEQGLGRLRTVCEAAADTPLLPSASRRTTARIATAALAIVLAGVAIVLTGLPLSTAPDVSADAPVVAIMNRTPEPARADQKRGPVPVPPDRTPGRKDVSPSKAPGADGANSAPSKARPPSKDRGALGVEPASVAGAPGMSRSGATAAGAGEQPRQQSEARQAPSPAPRMPQAADKNTESSQATVEGERSSGGSIAGGGAGSGRIVAVNNQWAQRETGVAGDAQEAEDQKEDEDKPAGSEQRGGLQPSLPDRTDAPSRELGINGPESDRAGTGRGGPSPVKKSRGTAALMTGVPVPDFVRGQTGPGAVAVTFEDIAPLTSPRGSAPGGAVAPRSRPESNVSRFDVPWPEFEAVQSYLSAWHADGANEGNTP